MKKYSLIIVFIIFFIAISIDNVAAIDVEVTTGWNRTINESDLSSGAGSNLSNLYESQTDIATITISNTAGAADNWRIDVKKADNTWSGNFALYVRRTSDGTGPGTITGGTSYASPIVDTNTEFFSGAGNRTTIQIQYKLTGVTITIPPDSYSTMITYTVVDTA